MTGWLVVNGFLKSAKFDELAQMFCEAADRYSVQLKTIKNSDCLVDTLVDPASSGGQAGRKRFPDREPTLDREIPPDFVVFWDKDILLAEFMESKGIPVYNSSRSIAVCDDKRKTHLALYNEGIPMPRTIFSPMTYSNIGYPDMAFLDKIEECLPYPMVVKEAYGSFGAQVWLAGDRADMEQIIENTSSKELIFQQYIAASRGKDIRLQVVGDRVIGAMYRYSETDFRANVTAGGHMRSYEPSDEETQLAIHAAHATGCDFAGVDLLFGEDGPVVCEVNSNAHFKNLLDCSGVNTAEEIIKYVIQQTENQKGNI